MTKITYAVNDMVYILQPDPGKPTATPMEAESEEKIPLETETPLDEIRTNTPDVVSRFQLVLLYILYFKVPK